MLAVDGAWASETVGKWVHSSGHWARTLRSLGADHVRAWYGGAGQAGGGDSCGCSPAGPWEGVRGQERGREGLGTGFGLKIREAGSP